MNHAPTTEMLVSITNIILRSNYGKTIWPNTPEGGQRFDDWQDILLRYSRMIHKTWYQDNGICEEHLRTFERLFALPFDLIDIKETI